MRITYTGPLEQVNVAGQDVRPGESITVPDTLGKSLCEQADAWCEAKPKTKTTTAEEA